MDHKEGWAPKNWCFQIAVLEKALESPLDCKEIKPVNPKENQPWIFIGRTEAEAEAPVLQPPDGKSRLIGKDSDTGKDRRQEEKGKTEDDMVVWHHQFNGHWVWANSGKWWRTGKPGMQQSMGLQRVRHDLVTEQQVSENPEGSILPRKVRCRGRCSLSEQKMYKYKSLIRHHLSLGAFVHLNVCP